MNLKNLQNSIYHIRYHKNIHSHLTSYFELNNFFLNKLIFLIFLFHRQPLITLILLLSIFTMILFQ